MIPFLASALLVETILLIVVGFLLRRAYKAGFIKRPIASNVGEGTWGGAKTFLADAAFSSRYLLGKIGSGVNNIALAGAADKPIGVITDEAAAIGDPVSVTLLGSSPSTVLMVAAGVITVGDYLMPAANGQVATMATGAGTYYCVGRALSTAAAGDLVQVDPIPAIKWVV